eukprot:Sdes_comp18466_c0_seq1m8445
MKSSNTRGEMTPLPHAIIACCFLALFANFFNMVMLFPFVPFMVRDFGIPEQDLGYYVGFIATSLFVGRALSSLLWGHLVDSYGRRLTLLWSTFSISLFTLCFGLSRDFYSASIFRFLTGFSNSIVIVAKAIAADVCDDSNQSAALNILSLGSSIGLVFGSAAGGLLSQPSQKFPEYFGPDSFFAKYPYSPPCLVSSLISTVAFISAYFLLPETLGNGKKYRQKTPKASTPQRSIFTKIFPFRRKYLAVPAEDAAKNSSEDLQKEQDAVPESIPLQNLQNPAPDQQGLKTTPQEGTFHSLEMEELSIGETSTETLFASNSFSTQSQESKEPKPAANNGLPKSYLEFLCDKRIVMLLLAYGLYSLALIGIDEIYPLWASTNAKYGGLQFDLAEIGISLSLVGILLIFMQMFVFSLIQRRWGPRILSIWAHNIIIVTILIVPFYSKLIHHPKILWPLLEISLLAIRFCSSWGFISLAVFINNSVSSINLGKVNGLSTLVATTMRAIGPTLCGSIFAFTSHHNYSFPFNTHCAFIMISLVLVVCNFVIISFPEGMEKKQQVSLDTIPEEESPD